MSLATVFVAFVELAPFLGWGLVWSAVFFALGHLVLWLTIPRILEVAGPGRTIHGFLADRFDSARLRLISSLATTVGFIGVFATELIIGSEIFRSLTNSDAGHWVGLLFVSLVVMVYSTLGGFRSVVRTDRLQSYVVVGLVSLLVWLGFSFGPSTTGEPAISVEISQLSLFLPPLLLLNFFLINVPFPLVDMSAWQRVVAARSRQDARAGVGSAGIVFLITWSGILFASLALAERTSGMSGAEGLVAVLFEFAGGGVVQLVLMGLGVAALVAAVTV